MKLDTDINYYLIEGEPALGIVTEWHEKLAEARKASIELAEKYNGTAIGDPNEGRFDGIVFEREKQPSKDDLKKMGFSVTAVCRKRQRDFYRPRQNTELASEFERIGSICESRISISYQLFDKTSGSIFIGNRVFDPQIFTIGDRCWYVSKHKDIGGAPIFGMKLLGFTEMARRLEDSLNSDDN